MGDFQEGVGAAEGLKATGESLGDWECWGVLKEAVGTLGGQWERWGNSGRLWKPLGGLGLWAFSLGGFFHSTLQSLGNRVEYAGVAGEIG